MSRNSAINVKTVISLTVNGQAASPTQDIILKDKQLIIMVTA